MTEGDNPVSTDRGENANENVDQFLRLNENYRALYRQLRRLEPSLRRYSNRLSLVQQLQ